MRMLFAAVSLCLASFVAHAQAPWPRNPKTGKVEFTGVLPWPATAKTEAQRQALVKRWYMAKLTDSSPAEVAATGRSAASPILLTYARLPRVTILDEGPAGKKFLLLYHADLLPLPKGLSYKLDSFELSTTVDEDDKKPVALEATLTTATANEQAALAALRKRLAKALAGWN